MIDHVKPAERLYGRRATDNRVRGWHIIALFLVAVLAAYGLAQKADDLQAEREPVQLAEQADAEAQNCGYLKKKRRVCVRPWLGLICRERR